jgi:hypothetical protein
MPPKVAKGKDTATKDAQGQGEYKLDKFFLTQIYFSHKCNQRVRGIEMAVVVV